MLLRLAVHQRSSLLNSSDADCLVLKVLLSTFQHRALSSPTTKIKFNMIDHEQRKLTRQLQELSTRCFVFAIYTRMNSHIVSGVPVDEAFKSLDSYPLPPSDAPPLSYEVERPYQIAAVYNNQCKAISMTQVMTKAFRCDIQLARRACFRNLEHDERFELCRPLWVRYDCLTEILTSCCGLWCFDKYKERFQWFQWMQTEKHTQHSTPHVWNTPQTRYR